MSMEVLNLPRHRAILALPKRCLVMTMFRSAPERRQIDRPISRMVEMKSSAKLPRVSATRVMHVKDMRMRKIRYRVIDLRGTSQLIFTRRLLQYNEI